MTTQPPGPPTASAGSDVADSEPPTDPPVRRRGGLFRHHDFRQLFFGDTISQFGTQLTMLALPILAIRVLGADAFQMGLLATFEFLAFLVIGLPAGAWVDRWRKQRVLVANDLLRALALGSLPLAWALDVLTFAQMLVVALVMGVLHGLLRRGLPELPAGHRGARGHRRGQRQAAGFPVRRDDRRTCAGRCPDQGAGRAADDPLRRAELRGIRLVRPAHPAHRHATTARGVGARCTSRSAKALPSS